MGPHSYRTGFKSGPGAQFTKLRKVNIRNSFAILSYLFRMSTDKLSYEKFMKELRKNYDG